MNKNYIILGQFVAILLLIIAFRECRPVPSIPQGVLRVDSFYRDTGTHTLVVKKQPVPYKVDVPKYIKDSGWMANQASRDSLCYSIMEDYLTRKYYRDSLNDSNINIVLNYSIYENKPADMQMKYRWKKPLVQITTITQAPADPKIKNSFWISNQLTVWQKLYIGTELGYMVRNRSMYAIGANLPISGTDKQVYFRYGYRIGK